MDDFARVKDAVDLVDVISRWVPLKRAGTRMIGLCPFHPEKTPSFGVQIGQRFFKCFGCGKGGDVFTFVAEIERIERVDALRRLAEDAGIELSGRGHATRDEKERLLRVLDAAQDLYRRALRSEVGTAARALVEARGVEPGTCDRFGIGYAPVAGAPSESAVISARLLRAGHRREDIVAAGVAHERRGELADTLRDRLTIPIRDERGRVIAFGGRRMHDGEDVKDPKYINSRETLLFSKSRVLFGLDQARPAILEQGRVVLVEGYLDVILAHQRGVTSAVAALGTSVTADHARALARLAERAILFLDSDDAGLRAAQRSAPLLLAEKMDVRVLVPRGVKDPGDYFAAGAGRDEFESLLAEHAQSALEFLLDRAGRREAISIEDRIQVVRRLGAMADGISDPLVRSACARGVARALDLPEEGVAAEIFPRAARRFARGNANAAGAESAPDKSAMHGNESAVVLDPKSSVGGAAASRAQVVAEEELLLSLLHEPSLRPAAGRLLQAGAIVNAARARLFVALVEDPQLPATVVMERVLEDSSIETEAQQTLLDLVHRPASADPGKLFDGALRWFERQQQRKAGEKIAESYRVGLARGEAGDAVEFLRRFEEARRARSCETGD